MFKTTLTATAFALIATLTHANPMMLNQDIGTASPFVQHPGQIEELSYYCEWATVYDHWGNWVTVWQCF